MKTDPFNQLPALMQLSSENIYRLMHLSGSPSLWNEESLTDVLRGHLAGADYRVVAACPVHKGAHRCGWSTSSGRDVFGGIRLTSKQTEEPIWGADILLVLTDGDPNDLQPGDQEAQFFIQAKRVRHLDRWEDRSKGIYKDRYFRPTSGQANALRSAAAEHSAWAYYLFYVQGHDPHEVVPGTCEVHTTPQDCAAILVQYQQVMDYLRSDDKANPRALLRMGTPLRCLGDACQGRVDDPTFVSRATTLARSQSLLAAPPTFANRRDHGERMPRIVINPSRFERTDASLPAISGDALVVILGKWTPNAGGASDGIGSRRFGSGWNPSYSRTDLKEAARQWWRVSSQRAATVRYLVAIADGEVKATYKITGAAQSSDGRYAFDVEEAPERTDRRLRQVSRQLLTDRQPGARNPITYMSI